MSRPRIDENLTAEKRPRNKKALFLESFALNANVMLSARAAGVSRQAVYQWLEKDEDFAFAFNLAKEEAKDTIRAEIYRRGVEGWDEDVYQLAKFAGTVRKYSDTLLIFHAKALMSEYREKQQIEHSGPGGGPIQTQQIEVYKVRLPDNGRDTE
jgi:hypothetical protein